jgi:hypothetical protein
LVLFVNFSHPLKAKYPISFNELGRFIFVKLTQSKKQQFPIDFIESGREICINDEHFQKQ